MMTAAEKRVEVFNDTMEWIDTDPDLSASIHVAKKNTEIFYEDDYPAFDSSNTKQMSISVSGQKLSGRYEIAESQS